MAEATTLGNARRLKRIDGLIDVYGRLIETFSDTMASGKAPSPAYLKGAIRMLEMVISDLEEQ